MDIQTSESLAVSAQKNPEDFALLVERFEKPLSRYIHRLSSIDKEEGEDILQEVFLKAWRHLQGFDEQLSFSSWIYRICHNEVISRWKKSQSKGREKLVEWNEELFGNLPDKINISEEFDRKETAKKVRTIMNTIPLKYQSALVLFFLEEKNYDEISDILQIPLGTVATRINRGKKYFRDAARHFSLSSS